MKVIIIGGGWAGCAAALSAKKQGADVVLLERMDMLLGTGLVGGIMRNNGRFTATEELIAMGGGEIFKAIDNNYLHKNIEFPGHAHASLYNVSTMEPIIRRLLIEKGIEIHFETRISKVEKADDSIVAVTAKSGDDIVRFEGDIFIETTGTAGPFANCRKHGNGCAMCILRCHSFGGRISVAEKAGIDELNGKKKDQIGAFSGSCKLHKESLSPEILSQLNKKGVVLVPIPESKRLTGKLALKACQQYALSAFEENIILLDTGHAKLMSAYYPLATLRELEGMENARYEDPYAGGIGNSVRYFGMSPRDDRLQVNGIKNLFCAGEKAGLLVGHTEAICTGVLAGYNAARFVMGDDLLTIPDSLSIGVAIQTVRVRMQEEGELDKKFTFSGSVLFEKMKEKNLYSTNTEEISIRVAKAGLTGIFSSVN